LGNALRAEPGTSFGQNVILLEIGPVTVAGARKDSGSEAYRLEISDKQGIRITGADADGVFYGIQSLLQLLPPAAFGKAYADAGDDVTLPLVTVEDAPRFAYRGQHFDVSHNFHGKDSILKLLDIMAFYKMNRFHFQVSDDEGWRIEIPELPELTDVSGGRAHTRDHDGVGHPIYGSGPYRYPETFGSGFYTRQQFIDILRHARSLHIEVIPEINLPAHARGAIIAMKVREKRLMAEGKLEEALKFRLHDPDDRSKYFSAQSFKDNCVCVVDEPVYHFADTIIRNFQEMFAEADAPLKTWHFGADEVPEGVWTESPRCAQFLREHPEINGPADLKNYFVRRIMKVIENRGLRAGCWQEAALDHVKSGATRRDNPRPEFSGGRLVPYVWNNTGGNADLCNRFANMGYPVVLCSVTNLYWDLAYNKDPLEPGLTWGGFVDAKSPFVFVPENVFLSTRSNAFGKQLDRAAMEKNLERLTEAGLKNVQGIQGQIWCETIKGPQMLEYYVFPKLIGLAERAWAARPAWAGISELAQHDAAVETAWNEFANRLGQRELPRLDFLSGGIGYRLPPPGAQIIDGQLHASSEYPGLTIRYTTDETAPTADSLLYNGPVKISGKGPVRISTFSSNGRAGRSSLVSVP
jgi:hexosaminidase